MSEKLCLKWNDFQDNVSTAFGILRSDTDFSDVTLACEDGQQVEAHKVILAASSPFFQNILKKNKHPHPLIYMRGMKSEDLVAIVDFLYYGEANVYQENIDAFLAIAEELNLKGLTGNSSTKEDDKPPPVMPEIGKRRLVSKNSKPKTENNKSDEEEETHHSDYAGETETAVAVPSYSVSRVDISDMQELDERINSMMRKSENFCRGGSRKADICTVCGKEGPGQNIKDHIEANHLEGVSIPCNYCEKTFRSRNSLRGHARTHSGPNPAEWSETAQM